MLLVGAARDATVNLVGADTEALIKEARRRRRRRWATRLLVGAVLLGGAAAVVVLAISGARSRIAGAAGTAGILPNGPLATLHVAGPLAVAPDRALYVTDVVRPGFQSDGDRVLVRLPDGRFRVVAGNGKVGSSGDGGPAIDAELSGVSDLAVGPDGSLYIADGGRIRTVSRDGVIHTIVGNGKPRTTIANGTPALSAALVPTPPRGNPLRIALSPSGQLYIATGGSQILRLTATGKLDNVRAIVTTGPGKRSARRLVPDRGRRAREYRRRRWPAGLGAMASRSDRNRALRGLRPGQWRQLPRDRTRSRRRDLH